MSIINLRTKAAFGGIMGRDGRRQYGGGSDMGQVGTDGKQGGKGSNKGLSGPSKGGYQGGPKGGYGDAGSNDKPSPTVRAKEKAKYEKQFGGVSPTGSRPRGFFDKVKKYNSDFQKKANIKLAQRRAFQKFKDLEQYVDPFDDYTMDGVKAAIARGYKVDGNILGNSGSVNFTGYDSNPLTNPDATDPSLGYDFSKLGLGKKTLTSNKGTSIEKTRPNLYDVNSNIPGKFGFLNAGFDKFRPDTQVTAMNTLNKAADYSILAGKPDLTRQDIIDLGNRGKTLEQINPMEGSGRLDQANILPIPVEEQDSEYTNDFTYRFGDNQDVIYENYGTPGYRTTRAADGGIMGTRARRAMGGIMNRVDQRQGYFLGKIVKGVGKAIGSVADAAGKVLKSDVGKMAIAGLGAYYMGGGMNLGGARMFGNTGFGTSGFMSNLGRVGTFIKDNPFKSIGLASVALPFLAGEAKPNEDNFSDRGGSLIDPLTGKEATPAQMRESIELAKLEAGDDADKLAAIDAKYNNMLNLQYQANLPDATPYVGYGKPGYRTTAATGGRIGKAEGGLLDLGGMEKDYRAEGGFVPIGEYEKKDDVPARLSVNEFVMTADAVRGAGQGDIDKGAEIMENMMKNLENGGTVSEESQGNKGAQQMFKTSERLGAII